MSGSRENGIFAYKSWCSQKQDHPECGEVFIPLAQNQQLETTGQQAFLYP